jgi:hypothetical protein
MGKHIKMPTMPIMKQLLTYKSDHIKKNYTDRIMWKRLGEVSVSGLIEVTSYIILFAVEVVTASIVLEVIL